MANSLTSLICILLLASAIAPAQDIPEDHLKKMEAALPAAAAAPVENPRHLLIYTRANGFVHKSIPLGAATIARMGEKTGAWTAEVTDDPAVFEWDRLSAFDGIFLVSTTGDWLIERKTPKGKEKAIYDPPLSDEELAQQARRRANLMRFVETEGRGLAGCHAASDCHYGWTAYGECLGGLFRKHPWNAGDTVTVRIEEPEHPLCAHWEEERFTITDEIYQFRGEPFSRERSRVLLSLCPEHTDLSRGSREDNDYPVTWLHPHGNGRVFYCSLGHNSHVYWDANVLQHLLAGIQYSLGDLEAADQPRP